MGAPKPKVKHDERSMTELLRAHYLPPNKGGLGVFAPQITSPDGKRQADLIWMPTTIAGGRGLIGHEIKVSRADVLAELAQPDKSESWAKYCMRWWLVVSDPALIDGLDIPDAWGIMAPPSGRLRRTMTTLRPAPALAPHGDGAGYARVASWLHYSRWDAEWRLRYNLEQERHEKERLARELNELRLSGGARRDLEAVAIGRLVAAAKERLREKPGWLSINLDDPQLVDILVDRTVAQEAVRTIARQGDALVREIDRLARSMTEPLGYARQNADDLREMLAALDSGHSQG